ncbi:hypothetical protein LZ31DRAFT_322174 [Colletotrichum somersetense]|nr:hypothetical protein LZ31DRAFT_322174 [Colletotrichum somersetense]
MDCFRVKAKGKESKGKARQGRNGNGNGLEALQHNSLPSRVLACLLACLLVCLPAACLSPPCLPLTCSVLACEYYVVYGAHTTIDVCTLPCYLLGICLGSYPSALSYLTDGMPV